MHTLKYRACFLFICAILLQEVSIAQYYPSFQATIYEEYSLEILDTFFNVAYSETWFINNKGSLFVFKNRERTIDSISTVQPGLFVPFENRFYIYGNSIVELVNRTQTIIPVWDGNSHDTIPFFKLLDSQTAVFLHASSMMPEYLALELRSGKTKPIRNPDPYEKPIGLEIINSKIISASTHSIHSTIHESGKWIVLASKTAETGRFTHITASKKELFFYSEYEKLGKIDMTADSISTEYITSPPFKFSKITSSPNGKLLVYSLNQIAWYSTKNNLWIEIPESKFNFIEGEIRMIKWVSENQVLLTSAQSFGLLKVEY